MFLYAAYIETRYINQSGISWATLVNLPLEVLFLFVIKKAKLKDIKDIMDSSLITTFNCDEPNPYKTTKTVTYENLKALMGNMYVVIEDTTLALVGMLGAKHTPIGDNTMDAIPGYTIEYFKFDENILAMYDSVSVNNMARMLVRTFVEDKTDYVLTMYYGPKLNDTTLTSTVYDALTYNGFKSYRNNKDNKTCLNRYPGGQSWENYYS